MREELYTRETLERIKRGATPRELGWTPERYERTCRKHGIECLYSASHKAPVAIPLRVKSTDAIIWDAKTGELTRGSASLALPRVMGLIFGVLYRKFRDDPAAIMSGQEVCDIAGTRYGTMANSVSQFNRRAERLQLRIAGQRVHPPGYRLIDLMSVGVTVASASVEISKNEQLTT